MPAHYASGTDMTIKSQEWLPIDRTAARRSSGLTLSSGLGRLVGPHVEVSRIPR